MQKERLNEIRRLQAYNQLAASNFGKIIIEDLKLRYLHQNPVGVVSSNNPIGTAYTLGQKELILAILRWSEANPEQSTKYWEDLDGDGAEQREPGSATTS